MICEPTRDRAKVRSTFATYFFAVIFLLAVAPAYGQQIHQLSYNGSSWMDQNLNGALAGPYTGIAAFLTTPNDQTHVYYVDNNGNYDVHQLFYNGTSWEDQNLTVISGAAKGAYGAAQVAGFSVGNYQYVYYLGGQTGHVHQLLYNNINWSDVDLTALTGGPNAQPYPLVAFTTSPTLHIYYTDWNLHIRQLHSDDGTTWQDQDLTSITGGTVSENAPGRTAGFNIGNFQYLYFVANTGHVHQFLYNNVGWSDEDLTVLSKSTPADARSNVQALLVPGTKKVDVFYISTAGHIVQLTSTDNKKWAKTDLSKASLAPGPQNFRVAAFTTAPHNELHVFYVGYTTNFHVLQLYKPQSQPWVYEDMTALTNGGIPESFFNDIAGFSFQNNQYLFYVAQ
jgi:hypothetical protein